MTATAGPISQQSAVVKAARAPERRMILTWQARARGWRAQVMSLCEKEAAMVSMMKDCNSCRRCQEKDPTYEVAPQKSSPASSTDVIGKHQSGSSHSQKRTTREEADRKGLRQGEVIPFPEMCFAGRKRKLKYAMLTALHP